MSLSRYILNIFIYFFSGDPRLLPVPIKSTWVHLHIAAAPAAVNKNGVTVTMEMLHNYAHAGHCAWLEIY